jgi:hypothetical protein
MLRGVDIPCAAVGRPLTLLQGSSEGRTINVCQSRATLKGQCHAHMRVCSRHLIARSLS